MTLADPKQILRQVDAAREAGYAWTAEEYYRGDLTIAAPVLGRGRSARRRDQHFRADEPLDAR